MTMTMEGSFFKACKGSLQGENHRWSTQKLLPMLLICDLWVVVVYRHEFEDLLLTQQNNRDAVDAKRATRGFALEDLEDFRKFWKKDSESIYMQG